MKTCNIVEKRLDFPMLDQKMHAAPLVYLDNGATTFKPKCVIDAIVEFYSSSYGTVHRAIYDLAEHSNAKYYAARIAIKDFIKASSEKEIIFTSGTTDSINKLAQSFGEAYIKEGDEILVSEIEHHSNLVPWQMLAKKLGAKLKFIPVNDRGELDLLELEKLLCENTKLISIAHISNVTGICHPVKEIVRCIRKQSSAKVLIDGAQAISHMPIDVCDLDVDFYVFSGHKMYGPTGIGILYGKEELLAKMPPTFGGGDMIKEVSLKEASYNDLPYKFEAGTPNISAVIGLKAAIDYILDLSFENIQAHEKELCAYALDKLKEIKDVQIIGESTQSRSLISFTVKNIHSLDIATLLNFKGIALRSGHLCAQPALKRFGVSAMLRISFALYNSFDEVDRFIECLKKIISKLG